MAEGPPQGTEATTKEAATPEAGVAAQIAEDNNSSVNLG
jgi:hypothetical protein